MEKINRKTLLYKLGFGSDGEYCLNYIEGCSHGCKYPCYAMMMKMKSGKIKNYQDWIKPKIVGNCFELLEKEIPKIKNKAKAVYMCFATDPFMYQQKEIEEMTLQIIERLNIENIKCILITKGVYPEKLLDNTKYSKENEYGITLVSLNKKFREVYEPGASTFLERIKSLKILHENGLKTWICMEPYPTPNIVKQDLLKILETIKFVDKIIFGKWNYNRYVSKYYNYKNFYNECSDIIRKFCKENNIEYYIKNGTDSRIKNNTKTLGK